MASRNSIEDLESGALDVKPVVDTDFNPDVEFQRIKENYRTTMIAAELPANYPESQVAFYELQNELQEFLNQHIPKVASLQVIMSSNFMNGSVHENRVVSRASRMAKTSMLIQSSDHENVDSSEDHANLKVQLDPDAMPSRHSSMKYKKAPTTAHMQALQSFLVVHMENILSLQSALSAPGAEIYAKRSTVSHNHREPNSHVIHDEDNNHEALAAQCHSVSAISTATAISTFALLILSRLILGNNRRIAFDVGMTFAFLSLFLHFGIIIIGGRGARHISQHRLTSTDKNKDDLDPVYFNFYLTVCEQMQLVATLLLMIATLVLLFLIFSSLGFPFLIVFLSALAAIVVLVSSYHKVLITTENLVFIIKNIRRLGWRTLDYVKTNVKTSRPTATYP